MTSQSELVKLHQAIKRGDLEAVREYLARGGAVGIADQGAWTPLTMAAHNGNTPIIRLLLDAGADVNERWPSRGTPLMLAAMAGSVAAVELLLARGAKTDAEGVPVPDLLRRLGYGHRTRVLAAIQKIRDAAA